MNQLAIIKCPKCQHGRFEFLQVILKKSQVRLKCKSCGNIWLQTIKEK